MLKLLARRPADISECFATVVRRNRMLCPRTPASRGCLLDVTATRDAERLRLFRDAQELLAVVAAVEQTPQRRGRILQAVLHVDFGLDLS